MTDYKQLASKLLVQINELMDACEEEGHTADSTLDDPCFLCRALAATEKFINEIQPFVEDRHPRYTQRTVEWGHWGITFMEPQPDATKNFGVIVGQAVFPVGSRGPLDARPGDREAYHEMIRVWLQGEGRINVESVAPNGCSMVWES